MDKFKTVRRAYMALCPQCGGSGLLPVKSGYVKCNYCGGRGEVLKWLNEIVHEDEDTEHEAPLT